MLEIAGPVVVLVEPQLGENIGLLWSVPEPDISLHFLIQRLIARAAS